MIVMMRKRGLGLSGGGKRFVSRGKEMEYVIVSCVLPHQKHDTQIGCLLK